MADSIDLTDRLNTHFDERSHLVTVRSAAKFVPHSTPALWLSHSTEQVSAIEEKSECTQQNLC